MPSVTVLTTFYNAASTLKETVQSILGQTFDDYEYLLIDDGSTDNSCEIVKSFNNQHLVLLQAGKIGRAEALNLGLERAQGDYVAILDADDIALPHRLEKQKQMLDMNLELCLVCSNAILIDEDAHELGVTSFPTEEEGLVEVLEGLNPFPHSSVMFRRNQALSFGGYNAQCEKSIDYNFYLEMLLAGGHLSGEGQPLIKLRSYPSSWGKVDNQHLQIRYGILGLINYHLVKAGGSGFMRGSAQRWSQVKESYDLWFDKRGFGRRLDAKKGIREGIYALKRGGFKGTLFSLIKAFKLDPLFWRYRGCGFHYPSDAQEFLRELDK
jgi:glycosyltransferase involved in cell wall biosynthesis